MKRRLAGIIVVAIQDLAVERIIELAGHMDVMNCVEILQGIVVSEHCDWILSCCTHTLNTA